MHAFLIGLQFLTRLPIRTDRSAPHKVADSYYFYPVIGLLIGVSAVILRRLLLLVFPPAFSIVIVLGFLIWISGGLHEDGLADVADGMGGGWSPEQRLAIMKDSRIGARRAAAPAPARARRARTWRGPRSAGSRLPPAGAPGRSATAALRVRARREIDHEVRLDPGHDGAGPLQRVRVRGGPAGRRERPAPACRRGSAGPLARVVAERRDGVDDGRDPRLGRDHARQCRSRRGS